MYTKEVVEKKKKRITNLIIATILVLLVLMIEVTYLYYKPKNNIKENEDFKESITNIINVGNIPSFEVANLNNEISALEFVDSVGSGLELNSGKYTARIENNSVILAINDKEIEYKIKSPKSIVIGALEDKYITVYVLSNEGKLYNIKYDLVKSVDSSCVYSINNVSSIDIDTGEVNIGNKENFEPSVYFKTTDNKIYTSDKLLDKQEYFIELIDN